MELPIDLVVANVTLTTATTEYSYVLPNGVSEVTIQSRAAQDFKLAVDSGASGTTYFTVKSGAALVLRNFSSFNNTLYMQSANNGQVVEIIYAK